MLTYKNESTTFGSLSAGDFYRTEAHLYQVIEGHDDRGRPRNFGLRMSDGKTFKTKREKEVTLVATCDSDYGSGSDE